MTTTHHFGNCPEFSIDYNVTRFYLDCRSDIFIGLAANVDRWLSRGAGAIDFRLGEIWGFEDDENLDRAMSLPLLARAIYVADYDGQLEDQAELCNA
ncbi:hypothetical protein K0U83_20830 [bacterium]|nr:hypothetical protein [bacterium]